MLDGTSIVEVKTIDGEIYRHWNIGWLVKEGTLSVMGTQDKYAVYAAGQWIYALDVEPQ